MTRMKPRHWIIGMLATVTVVLIMPAKVPAQEAPPGGEILGFIFVDTNEDSLPDPGEPGLAGAVVEVSDGSNLLTAVSDSSGAFSLQVAFGTWSVVLQAPDGHEVINDRTRQVSISEETTTQSVLEFAVRRLSVDGQTPSEPEELPASEVDAEEALAPAEATENEATPTEPSSDLLVLLPESGANLPPWLALGLLGAATLASGVGLLLLGKRLASRT